MKIVHNKCIACGVIWAAHRMMPFSALFIRLVLATGLILSAFVADANVVLTTLHSFNVLTNGANPLAGLVQGSDGNFYGTTFAGGTNGDNGTVFKISTNGVLTTLYSFNGGNDGSKPYADLVQGGDGYFYGTTYEGGTNGYGTVFKISNNGVLTTLHTFAGYYGSDGGNPETGLVQGSDGYFYGTTASYGIGSGGYGGSGTIFRMSTNGALTTMYTFGGAYDTWEPNGLVQGNDGNIYGTTFSGGTNGDGTIFKITTNGVLTFLYFFTGGNDGWSPAAGVVQGSDGNFYGTTWFGGKYQQGNVFKFTTNGVLTSLYSFTGGNDGNYPKGTLLQGRDGNFYGLTLSGGTNGFGSVFKINSNGIFSGLYSFNFPLDFLTAYHIGGGLVQSSDGNLYGTTFRGGAKDLNSGSTFISYGTVFKISTNGELAFVYSFPSANDGSKPYAGLVQGTDGNFYGTTSGEDQNGSSYSCGSVFKICTNGAFTTLYDFGSLGYGSSGSLDGEKPKEGLQEGSDGNFYGTTTAGGSTSVAHGTLFKISTNGVLTTLVQGTSSMVPYPRLMVQKSSDRILAFDISSDYITNYNCSVFQINPNGSENTLFSLSGSNGAGPDTLMVGSDGNFYGTGKNGGNMNVLSRPYNGMGAGTISKISPNGVLTILHAFGQITNAAGLALDGANPYAPLVQGSDGNLYGTTTYGGTNLSGTVFKITTNGVLTTLYWFNGASDGGVVMSALVQGGDSNFYGTSYEGGTNGYGVVFQISPNGVFKTLYSFTGLNDGGYPYAGLVLGSDGNFYGTTQIGGQGAYGTVFQLILGSPTITSQPTNQSVAYSNNAIFSVTASGSWPLSFQWLFNKAKILDATNNSLLVSNIGPANLGNYSVVITNAYGSVTSSVASLTRAAPAPTSVNVTNFSFEQNVASGPGNVVTTVPIGWTAFNEAGSSDIGSQWAGGVDYTTYNPLATPAAGNQYCYINMFNPSVTGGISQDVGALQANTVYTLTVAIGSRHDRSNSRGIISLVRGTNSSGAVLTSGGGLPGVQNAWQDYAVTFATGASVSGDLTIVLSVLGNNTTIQADFDNVRLTKAPVLVLSPTLEAPKLSGGNLILTGHGGTPGAGYTWLTTTNLSTPINWTTNSSGTLDGTGAFSNTIPINASQPESFFRLRLP